MHSRDADVPYTMVDAIEEFATKVIDPFVNDYANGVTPNPCVLCNQQVRFEYMVKEFLRMNNLPFSENYKIATGHYARVEEREGHYYLKRGVDKNKRSILYALSSFAGTACPMFFFPLGEMFKPDVRKLAEKWNLHAAKKSG